jgi:hypothetical protein
LNLDLEFQDDKFEGLVKEKKQFKKENYADFVHFLNSNLKKDETFLDFSNTPMLHFYAQRKALSYFCQPLQNSIDDYLQFKLIARNPSTKVPIIVFSSYPKNGFDAIDGTPNSLRNMHVAEYIFTYYEPFSIINNKSIWTLKERKFNIKNQVVDTTTITPETHNYGFIAGQLACYYNNISSKKLKKIHVNEHNLFEIPSTVSKSKHVYAEISFSKDKLLEETTLLVYSKDKLISRSIFNVSSTQNSYFIRLSNHYLWYQLKADRIEVLGSNSTKIRFIHYLKELNER